MLPVDKATMEAMGIDLETPLQLTVTGNTLVVTPVHAGLSEEEVSAYDRLKTCRPPPHWPGVSAPPHAGADRP